MLGGNGDLASFRTSADAYDRHVGRYGAALGSTLIERAGVRPGCRVLDVGCGTGALTAELARVVGAENVAAVDPSPSFLERCRLRVPGADVRAAMAEELPFAAGEFDAVLSQLVVNFMADPTAGLREMCRVARPGATVGGAVWDYADGMTLLRSYWEAAAEVDRGASTLDEGRRMRYRSSDELAALWQAAGLLDTAVDSAVVSAGYDGFDDLWQPFVAGVGPAGAHCASLDPADRERLRGRFFAKLGSPAGAFELSARAWIAIGRTPVEA